MQARVSSSLRSFLRNAHCTRPQTRPYSTPLLRALSNSRVPAVTRTLASPPKLRRPPTSFARTQALSSSTPPPQVPTTLADPSRPSLFYHLLPAPNPLSSHLPAYAVSFLDRPPANEDSPAVLGWLPAAGNASADGGAEAGLGDFKENPKFMDLVYEVIRKAVEDGTDDRLQAEAMQLGEGWMHINDDRNLPPMGRISSPDDIIASVRVEDGQMLPDTYSPMPTYRTCTADGLTTLSQGLERRLLDELRRREGGVESWNID